jgi:hypothetical protein
LYPQQPEHATVLAIVAEYTGDRLRRVIPDEVLPLRFLEVGVRSFATYI